MKSELILAAYDYIYQLDDFPKQSVLNQISKELDEIYDLNDDDVLKARLDYIGKGQKEDYLNRLIKTSEGFVLAGIRHLGGNKNEPFIYLWPTFLIENLDTIINEVSPFFKVFTPKFCVFWIRPDRNKFRLNIMQQRFVGRIDEMTRSETKLSRLDSFDYSKYETEYAFFHQDYPELSHFVPINSKALMDECISEGFIYELKKKIDKLVSLQANILHS